MLKLLTVFLAGLAVSVSFGTLLVVQQVVQGCCMLTRLLYHRRCPRAKESGSHHETSDLATAAALSEHRHRAAGDSGHQAEGPARTVCHTVPSRTYIADQVSFSHLKLELSAVSAGTRDA